MDYKQKYHKYKTKYLNLKQELQKQTGGKIFNKKQILYIVATISQPKLKKTTKEITDTIIGKNIKPYRAPHITVLNLTINSENEDSRLFVDEKFYNKTKDIYAATIANKDDPLILKTKPFPKGFTLPGYRPRYFLKNYKPVDPQQILNFRAKIFDLINSFMGKPKIVEYTADNGARYYIYSYHGRELFAESSYYDTWKPHINFLNDFDIEKHNPDLYKEINKIYGYSKVNVLLDQIKDIPQEIYDEIDMSRQMRNMTYAIDHVIQVKFKT